MPIKLSIDGDSLKISDSPNKIYSTPEGYHVDVGAHSTGIHTRGVQKINIYTHPVNEITIRLSSRDGSCAMARFPNGEIVTAHRCR